MKDYFDDYNEINDTRIPESDSDDSFSAKESADAQEPVEAESASAPEAQEYEEISSSSEETKSVPESSYEWNATGSEYRHSYINGNNSAASHNPNNYENAYSTHQGYGYQQPQAPYTNPMK